MLLISQVHLVVIHKVNLRGLNQLLLATPLEAYSLKQKISAVRCLTHGHTFVQVLKVENIR